MLSGFNVRSNRLEDRKTGTSLAGTLIVSPDRGFRMTRAFRGRNANVPKRLS